MKTRIFLIFRLLSTGASPSGSEIKLVKAIRLHELSFLASGDNLSVLKSRTIPSSPPGSYCMPKSGDPFYIVSFLIGWVGNYFLNIQYIDTVS